MTRRVLAGKRIVITRPRHKAESFAAQLRDLGAEPVLLPAIEIQSPADPTLLDRAITHLADYDWLIVTSANTVTQLWQRMAVLGVDSAVLDWPSVAVIGPATGRALETYGIRADLMPDQHVAEALFEALNRRVVLAGRRVLLPQGDLARLVLADLLREAGAFVDAVIAYENVRPEMDTTALADPVDAVTFTSSSTVENFAAMFDDPLAVLGGALVACIGPITANTARVLGLPVHIVAEPHTAEGLIAALCEAFERKPAT